MIKTLPYYSCTYCKDWFMAGRGVADLGGGGGGSPIKEIIRRVRKSFSSTTVGGGDVVDRRIFF